MARVVLDSGAVIGWSRRDPEARAFIRRAVEHRDLIVVPAVVVVETTRGGARDAPVNQVLKSVNLITPVTEITARMAGRLLAGVGPQDATVDALVAAEAVTGTVAMVLTSDVEDMSSLLVEHRHIKVYGV